MLVCIFCMDNLRYLPTLPYNPAFFYLHLTKSRGPEWIPPSLLKMFVSVFFQPLNTFFPSLYLLVKSLMKYFPGSNFPKGFDSGGLQTSPHQSHLDHRHFPNYSYWNLFAKTYILSSPLNVLNKKRLFLHFSFLFYTISCDILRTLLRYWTSIRAGLATRPMMNNFSPELVDDDCFFRDSLLWWMSPLETKTTIRSGIYSNPLLNTTFYLKLFKANIQKINSRFELTNLHRPNGLQEPSDVRTQL